MHQLEACFSAVQSHATQALVDSRSLLHCLITKCANDQLVLAGLYNYVYSLII